MCCKSLFLDPFSEDSVRRIDKKRSRHFLKRKNTNFQKSLEMDLSKISEEMVWSILRRCGEFQEVTKSWKSPPPEIFENLCFFSSDFATTSFCLFLVLNLPKKGPKTGNVDNVPKIFCFLLIPVLKCLKSGPFCQLFEVQF